MNIIEFIPHANFTEYSDEEFYESYDNIIKDNSKWDNKPINNSNVKFNYSNTEGGHVYGSIYFDGNLESEMGYDIAMHVGGIIDQDFKTGDTFKAIAIQPASLKRIECIGIVGKYNHWSPNKHYVLIMTPEDYSNFINKSDLTAEMDGVTFKKETQ
jgi:hypothetical protein